MPLTEWGLHRFFENFRDNSLKGGLSNDITLTPPLFSLENTFKKDLEICQGGNCYILTYSFILKYKKCHIQGIMSLKMNLKFAALLGDEVRHNRPVPRGLFMTALQ